MRKDPVQVGELRVSRVEIEAFGKKAQAVLLETEIEGRPWSIEAHSEEVARKELELHIKRLSL